VVDTSAWEPPALFRVLQEAGKVETSEMFRAFNQGIGMIVICDTAAAAAIRDVAAAAGVDSWMLGHLRPGTGRVHLV